MFVGAGQEAFEAHVDHPRVDLRQRRVIEAVLAHRAGLEVFGDDVGTRRKLARNIGAFRQMEVDRDALLVAVEHRKETGPRAEQAARTVAVDRFDLDHFGAHVGEHHAARRSHDHVREFDDAESREGVRRSVGDRFHQAGAPGALRIVFGKPARHNVPCSVSPSSHRATFARNAINASKSSPVATPMLANR